MVKIDFTRMPIWVDISHKAQVVKDISKGLADSMYSYGSGIACHALALKIYNSTGEIELDDNEYKLLISYAEQVCTPAIIDALKEIKKENV